jgi:hypothetical protein
MSRHGLEGVGKTFGEYDSRSEGIITGNVWASRISDKIKANSQIYFVLLEYGRRISCSLAHLYDRTSNHFLNGERQYC